MIKVVYISRFSPPDLRSKIAPQLESQFEATFTPYNILFLPHITTDSIISSGSK